MEYTTSSHYREDPFEEIDAALDAGNTPESVEATLQARLAIEQRRAYRSPDATARLEQQLAYLGGAGLTESAA